jgi:hypothetical protein
MNFPKDPPMYSGSDQAPQLTSLLDNRPSHSATTPLQNGTPHLPFPDIPMTLPRLKLQGGEHSPVSSQQSAPLIGPAHDIWIHDCAVGVIDVPARAVRKAIGRGFPPYLNGLTSPLVAEL